MARGHNFYQKEFVEKEKSIRQIAQEQNENYETVRREMKKLGFKPRSKEKAMELAKKKGRCKSPFEESGVPDDVRDKISETLKEHWRQKNASTKEGVSDISE